MFQPSQNAQAALYHLIDKGVPAHIAAGMVGNYATESGAGLNPGAYNPNENAVGIVQWTPSGGRRAAVEELARANGLDFRTLGGQLDAAWLEKQGPEARAWAKVQGAKSAAEAAALYDQYYERSSGEHRDRRVNYATNLYDWYQQGGLDGNEAAPDLIAAALASTGGATDGRAGNSLMGGAGNDSMRGGSGNDRLGGGEFRSIMDPREDEKGMTFHPGLGLSSLGAAIAASGENRSAAQDLDAIRRRYFGQRAADTEREQKFQEREALGALLKDSPYQDLYEGWQQGMNPEYLLSMLNTREAQQHDRYMQDDRQAYGSAESAKDRAMRLGMHDDKMKVDWARVGNEERRIVNQADQFAQQHGLDRERFTASTEQFALQHALDVSNLDLNTELGRAAKELADLKFKEQLRAAGVAEGMDAKRFDRDIANDAEQKRQFEQRFGMTVEQFEFQKKEADRAAEQWGKSFGLDEQRLANDFFYKNAQIDNWGIQNENEKERIKQANEQFTAQHQLAENKFAQTLEATGNMGASAKEFIASGYEANGDTKTAAKIRAMPDQSFSDPSMVAQYRQIMEAPYTSQDSRTSAMKNFDRYQSMKAKAAATADPELKEILNQEAESFWEAAGPKETTFNFGDKAAIKQYEADRKLLDADHAAVSDQRIALNLLQQMERLLVANPNMETGVLYETFADQMAILSDLGIGTESFRQSQDARTVIDGINNYLATLTKTSGSVSNMEMINFKHSNAGVGTPTEHLQEKIDMQKAMIETAAAREQFIGLMMEQGEGKNPIGYRAAQAKWDKMVEEGAEGTNPQFYDLDKFTPENLRRLQGELGPPEIGGVIYLGGKPVYIEDAQDLADVMTVMNAKMQGN